ncbi:MAG: hypothetical protein Q7R90_03845 [bacterium]|nr:hypothetical protein [bacterium]
MSKSDMLGSIRRALPAVRGKHLGLVRDVVHKLGGEDADAVHQTVAAALREKPAPVVKNPTLTLVKSMLLAATSATNTAECLVGDIYGYRDPDIDRWLPKMQPARKATKVAVYAFGKDMTFAIMARAVVKVGEDVPLDEVGKLLKKRKHTLTLPQLDILVKKQEAGEDVGLRTDGWGNFVFVENEDGSVSVADVGRDGGRWDRDVRGLGRGGVWDRVSRLVLSNSVAQTL